MKGLGCRFGNGETLARCDRETGELTVCADVSLDCAQWRDEPTSCASFYVQGEVPVPWCSPERVGNMAGAYDRPVDCVRGVVGFEGVKDDVGIESSQDHRRSTCVQGSVKPHAQSVHVEEGQAQDKPVVR